MNKLKFLIPILLGTFITYAQTSTTIDYSTWSTSQCNAFGNGATINGKVHRSIAGQPQYSSANGVDLRCQYNGSASYGTQYEIQHNFLSNHQYTITVLAAAITNGWFPGLNLSLSSSAGPSNSLCAGPVPNVNVPSNGQTNSIGSITFGNTYFDFNPAQNFSKLLLTAIPDFNSSGSSAIQWILIKKIIITDNTPPAPPFNLTTSSTSRTCGTQNPVTFTVQNPTNATVSGYKFYPEPGKWKYNGSPAPTEITSPTNSIVLTPESCAGNASVTGKAVWQSIDVPTNAASVSVTTPDLTIYGPDNLIPNEGGYFDVQGVTSTPINYSWPCTGSHVTWSSSVPNQSTFYNTSGVQFNTYFYTHYNILDNSPFGMSITVSADVDMCSVTKHLTKNVYINHQSPLSKKVKINGNESSLEMSVTPNPSNGKFKIILNNNVENADVMITSLDGRLINRIKLSGADANLDLSSATSGIYFIKVVNKGEVLTEKIMKQ